MVQSFFNPAHVDLGVLSGYGMYFGVQWPWVIGLTLYHATISTLIPIAIIELLWPEYKDVPLLKKRGLTLAFTGIILVTVFWMIFMVAQQGDAAYMNYHPNPLLLVGSFAAVVLLAWLAYRYKNSRISTNKAFLLPPFVFGIAGFLFQAFNLLMPNMLTEANVSAPITLLAQFILVALVLLFVAYQIYHQNITKRHIVSLIFGSILFFILLTPVHEFAVGVNPDPTQGMLAVGIVSLILLILWRRTVLKNEGSQSVSNG